jgi:AcrR family transcriptional regulator
LSDYFLFLIESILDNTDGRKTGDRRTHRMNEPAGEFSTTSDGQTRRRLESRRRLLSAARKQFVERGYHATRPQDIAREAGVAAGTFYLHFKSKEAAFLAVAEDARAELYGEYEGGLAGVSGLRARLQVILETLASFGERNPGLLSVAFMDPVSIAPEEGEAWRMYEQLGGFVELALGDQVAPADRFDLALISHALCGFVMSASVYAGRQGMALDTVSSNVVEFIEGALGQSGRAATERLGAAS